MYHLPSTEGGDKSQQQDLAEVAIASLVLTEEQSNGLQVLFKVEGLFVTTVGMPVWKKVKNAYFRALNQFSLLLMIHLY